MPKKIITYREGKVYRLFTPVWAKSGNIKKEDIAKYVKSMVVRIDSMADYIEALHNEIDRLKSGKL